VLGVGAAAAIVGAVASALSPAETAGFERFHNPFGVRDPGDSLLTVALAGVLVMLGASLAALGGLVVRLPRAESAERRQLRWVLAACALPLAAVALYAVIPSPLTELALLLAVLSVPVAAAAAVLRYRLYAIDTIIERGLVYVPLFGLLAGLYVLAVVALQRILPSLTSERSDLAILFSAVVLAVVFAPTRKALQAIVDRHFEPDTDPARRLGALAAELDAEAGRGGGPDPLERLARRFAEEAAAAADALGARVDLGTDELAASWTVAGGPGAEPALRIPLVADGRHVGFLQLATRRSGRPFTERDRRPLEATAARVALAVIEVAAAPR
jgi:hypothetical protein